MANDVTMLRVNLFGNKVGDSGLGIVTLATNVATMETVEPTDPACDELWPLFFRRPFL